MQLQMIWLLKRKKINAMLENIYENSIYADQTTRDEILKDKSRVADIFWINTLGLLNMHINHSDKAIFKKYLKNIDKTRIDSIDDQAHDAAIATKLAYDSKMINIAFTTEFTKLLYLLKTRTDITLDEVKLREMFNKIIFANIRPQARIADEVKDWLDGKKTLNQIMFPLFYVAKYGKHSDDFQTYIKYFYKDFSRKAIDLRAQLMGKGVSPLTAAKGGSTTTTSANPVVPPVTVSPPPAVVDPLSQLKQSFKQRIDNYKFEKNKSSALSDFYFIALLGLNTPENAYSYMKKMYGVNITKSLLRGNVLSCIRKANLKKLSNPQYTGWDYAQERPTDLDVEDLDKILNWNIVLLNYIYVALMIDDDKSYGKQILLMDKQSVVDLIVTDNFFDNIVDKEIFNKADPFLTYVMAYKYPTGKNLVVLAKSFGRFDIFSDEFGLNWKKAFLDELFLKRRTSDEVKLIDQNLVLSQGFIDYLKDSDDIIKYEGASVSITDAFLTLYPETAKRYSKHFLSKLNLDFKSSFEYMRKSPRDFGLSFDSTLADFILKAVELSKTRILDDSNGDITFVVEQFKKVPASYGHIFDFNFNGFYKYNTIFNLNILYDKFLELLDYQNDKHANQKFILSLMLTGVLGFLDTNHKIWEYIKGDVFTIALREISIWDPVFNDIFIKSYKIPFSMSSGQTFVRNLVEQSLERNNGPKNIIFKFDDITELFYGGLTYEYPAFNDNVVNRYIDGFEKNKDVIFNKTTSMNCDVERKSFTDDGWKVFEEYFTKNFDMFVKILGFNPQKPERFAYDSYKTGPNALTRHIKVLGPKFMRALYDYFTQQKDSSYLLDGLTSNILTSESKEMLFDSGIMGIEQYTKYYLGKTSSDDMEIFDKVKDSISPEQYIKMLEIVVDKKRSITTYKKYVEDTKFLHFYSKLADDTTIPISKKRKLLQEAYDLIKINPKTGNVKDNYAANILTEIVLVKGSLLDVAQNSEIPLGNLTTKQIEKILEFNNFSIPETEIPKYNDKKMDLFQHLDEVSKKKFKIPPIKATKVERTEEELEKKTVELKQYYNNRHGRIGAIVLAEYDVNMHNPEFDEFIKKYPEPTVIPAFHGTGSVSASMILRFGFKIVNQDRGTFAGGAVKVAGKLLGNGIYFTNVVSKAIQYLGNDGWGRQIGVVGYVIEMEAYLGEKIKNYDSRGLGGDSIRSPEWAVYDPKAQLKIKKMYKVKLVDVNTVNDLEMKHYSKITPIAESVKPMKFKEFLKEESKHVTKFVFMDGTIPNKKGDDTMPISDFKFTKKIRFGHWQQGPEIDIDGGEETQTVVIPDTKKFMRENPDKLYDLWRKLTK